MGCESTAFEAAEGESGVDGSAQHGIGLLTKPCIGYILWLETDTVLEKCIKTECSEKEQKRRRISRPHPMPFSTRRPQAQQPLYRDGHTATGPAQDGHARAFTPLAMARGRQDAG